jgi:hypothetical protein
VSKQKPLHNILLYSQQKKNSSSSSCDMTTEEWGKKNHTSASSSQLLNKTNSTKCYQNPESFTSHGRRRTTKGTVISRETDYHIQSFAGYSDPQVSMCITTSNLREMHVPKYK